MRNRILLTVACLLVLLAPAPAPCVSVDVSDGGMEVAGPQTIIMHNVLVGSAYYYVAFQWLPVLNVWRPVTYGVEDSSVRAADYYPLDQGDTWTYLRSSGGTLTLTVNGTGKICGRTCIRLEADDGSATYWISDESGIFMTRYIFTDGSYLTWCPPMKITPAQLYLGAQSLSSFTDAPLRLPSGVQVGSQSGWTSFAVKGIEDVTVPAGTFTDCFRSMSTRTGTDTWTGVAGVRVEEGWYAYGVGIVKWINGEVAALGGAILQSACQVYTLQSYSVGE